jgi:hypothetical protein
MFDNLVGSGVGCKMHPSIFLALNMITSLGLSEIKKTNMQEFTSTKLEAMGIFVEIQSTIVFQGRCFSRGPSFSLRNKAIALSFCEREERRGYNFLLVESPTSVSVWKEIKVATKITDESIPGFDKQAFMECCRQELTNCIGPMAILIINELSSNLELVTPNDFLDKIEAQIPDSKLANDFKTNVILAWDREIL